MLSVATNENNTKRASQGSSSSAASINDDHAFEVDAFNDLESAALLERRRSSRVSIY